MIFEPETTNKLLKEYESVTQKVLFGNAVLAALMSGRRYDTFIFRKLFYFSSGLNIIGYGNPDNNLESPCITMDPNR
jgi:hypothetical protein